MLTKLHSYFVIGLCDAVKFGLLELSQIDLLQGNVFSLFGLNLQSCWMIKCLKNVLNDCNLIISYHLMKTDNVHKHT